MHLKIHALVSPAQTHRVRIVIADAEHDRLDSGLFLKAGSLRSESVTAP